MPDHHPSNRVTFENVEDVFRYHPPADAETIARYRAVREMGLALAESILEHTPVCADQAAAIRKVREAVMTANAAIALTPVPDLAADTEIPL